MITNLLWLMYSTGVYITAIKQYLRRHADKLHPIPAWRLRSFVLECVCLPHVVQCPVISYHHSVRSTAEQTAICCINTNVCMCLRAFGGLGGGLWQSVGPGDKGSGQICPADMEELISITNVLNHSTKTKRNSPSPNRALRKVHKKQRHKNNLLLWSAWRLG